MQNAIAALSAAGAREADIAQQLTEARAKLKARKDARRGTGSGKLKMKEQRKDDALNALISRLERGILPGESAATTTAAPAELAASAQRHAQHHAAPAAAPTGRPANATANPAASAAAAASSGATGDGDDDDGDGDDADGKQLAEFGAQYYTVPRAQKVFNLAKTQDFFNDRKGKIESPIYHPPNVLKSGCDPATIGLGALHVHAPKLYMGLLHPPCPHCKSWASVDARKVSVKGTCPARRVYADVCDEWLVGQKMICGVCRELRSKLTAELEGMEQEDDTPTSMIDEKRRERDAQHYSYRSYNAASTRMYAERYPWCAPGTELHSAIARHASASPCLASHCSPYVVRYFTGTSPHCRTWWSTTRRR